MAPGRTAHFGFPPMQPRDVPITCADVGRLRERVGFEPNTPLAEGLAAFVAWFVDWKARRARFAER